MTTLSFKSDVFKFIFPLNEIKESTINKPFLRSVYYYIAVYEFRFMDHDHPTPEFDYCLITHLDFSTQEKNYGLYVYQSRVLEELEHAKDVIENHTQRVHAKLIRSGQHSFHVSDILTERTFTNFVLHLKEMVLRPYV
jgi:recombinational DNA repair protein (RecF pathway)